MKITPQDSRVLKQLRTNKGFVEYLEKVIDWICDIRNGDYTDETRKMTKQVIQDEIINRIQLQNKPKLEEPMIDNFE